MIETEKIKSGLDDPHVLTKLPNSIRENNKHLCELAMCPPVLSRLYDLVSKTVHLDNNITTARRTDKKNADTLIDLSDHSIISVDVDEDSTTESED